jgi:serine/threonine protein kinase/Tol biopolymer transport system component
MVPEKIGRYIINVELGRGGMATVFRAKDPNFGRDVAVKILPHTFLHDPQFRVRFEREAKTIAALEHAAIVPVYDFGEDDGQPFIVMRLMSGGSLADKLERGKLSLEESVRIITQLAPGLDAAHKSGIIHRDLKPGNILFDQYNNAYLSDFGIARLQEGDSTLTGTRILGTPAYMSPEQIQGGKSIDSRSDIYAMGVIFFQMLVGNTPFQATTPAKVMMMHILEPIPDIMKSLPTLPVGIEAWCKKILAKDPDERITDAIEMSTALEAAMRGEYPAQSKQTIVAPAWENETKQNTPISAATIAVADQPYQPQVEPQSPPEVYSTPPPSAERNRLIPFIIGAAIVFGVGAISIIAMVFSGLNGNGPLAMLASDTATVTIEAPIPETIEITPVTTITEQLIENQPVNNKITLTPLNIPLSPTAILPTSTTEPTATEETLKLGGADKIAFVNENDIWLMNVDGSDLQEMTTDGAVKTNLGWYPDGSALTYISGNCIRSIEVESGIRDNIACFESAEYLENFSFSPDGTKVAISLNRELYVVPYDLARLQSARYNRDLKDMSECDSLAPVVNFTGSPEHIKVLRWSNNGERMIIRKLANINGIQGDLIEILDFQSCQFAPNRADEIPGTRFSLGNYSKNPVIEDFGYDGETLIALVSFNRNDGYGDLYIYNTFLHKVGKPLNPINNQCCYRDPKFSPDGRYIVMVYQPLLADAKSQLFYIEYGSIGSGATYAPIPLPEGFFADSRVKPQPALRPAQ